MQPTWGMEKAFDEGPAVFCIPVSCVACGEPYTGWTHRFQEVGCTILEGATPVVGKTGAFEALIGMPLSNKAQIGYDEEQGNWIAQWVQTHTSNAEARRALEQLGVPFQLSSKKLVWQARGPTKETARDNLVILIVSRLVVLAVGSHAHGFVFPKPMPYSFSLN